MTLLTKILDFFFPKRIKLSSFGRTDTGLVRAANEDSYALQAERNIYLVADGMGGHNGGKVASRLAIQSVLDAIPDDEIRKSKNNSLACRHLLIQAFRLANQNVLAAAAKDDDLLGMGCTLICALVNGCQAHICHVGDVRGYLLRHEELRQITSDHSLAANTTKKGVPKNIVTRCIGVTMDQDPEYHCIDLQKDDQVLLCSDGLWNMVDDAAITVTLKKSADLEEACTSLIDQANNAGGRDNITAVILRVKETNCPL